MTHHRQLPGRIEALRLVLHSGIDNAPAHLLRIAGMGHDKQPRAAAQLHGAIAFAAVPSGLSAQETAQLPF